MNDFVNTSILKSLSIGGYRSFGHVQRFEHFSKVNLLIGQNNSGKSNVLRFIHSIYAQINGKNAFQLSAIDRHLPFGKQLVYGVCLHVPDDYSDTREFNEHILPIFNDRDRASTKSGELLKLFRRKSELDKTSNKVWFEYDESRKLIDATWTESFSVLERNDIYGIWCALTNQTGGSLNEHWIPETIKKFTLQPSTIQSVIIPAIRQIGIDGHDPSNFSGKGIIEKLAQLQNPTLHNQSDRDKFKRINDFLVNVTDNNSARIEIPHDRNSIVVHMDGKILPLDSLGTGIHEVIILAAAATTLENTVICMEEPELHLNPILQKKLIRYLSSSTNNQYFICTHSAALMDTPNAETYHISMINNESQVTRVTSDKHRSEICKDLGYHPSDLLQTNCIIWVEGPSDRIYINSWLKSINSGIVEGIHYSIMFYGGRLASHLSGDDYDEFLKDFISLRRLNRRAVIVIDSDKASPHSRINETKSRLKEEFDKGPGYAWVTKGREMENYIKADFIKEAIKNVKPSASPISGFGQFENVLSIKTRKGEEEQASKVGISNFITTNYKSDLSVLDLNIQMQKLIKFILESNPSTH